MSKRLITTGLQYIAFLGIGLLFAWLSLRELDQEKWTQMKASIQRAELWLIIPVSLLLVISHYLRGLRWKLLIDPMGHEVKPMNTFLTVLIGYLVNLGVPRLGEFIRCTALSRYEKIEVEKLVGTVIVERLFDAVCLLLVFGLTLSVIMMITLANAISAYLKEHKWVGWLGILSILWVATDLILDDFKLFF